MKDLSVTAKFELVDPNDPNEDKVNLGDPRSASREHSGVDNDAMDVARQCRVGGWREC